MVGHIQSVDIISAVKDWILWIGGHVKGLSSDNGVDAIVRIIGGSAFDWSAIKGSGLVLAIFSGDDKVAFGTGEGFDDEFDLFVVQ